MVSSFPPTDYIAGAKIVLEDGLIVRITFSGLMGKFKFNLLPIRRQYTLTVIHPKY